MPKFWALKDLLLYLMTTVERFGGRRSLSASWTCMERYQLPTETPMFTRLSALTKPTLEIRSSGILWSFCKHNAGRSPAG